MNKFWKLVPKEGRLAACRAEYVNNETGPQDAHGRCAVGVALQEAGYSVYRKPGSLEATGALLGYAAGSYHASPEERKRFYDVSQAAWRFMMAFDDGELLGKKLCAELGVGDADA